MAKARTSKLISDPADIKYILSLSSEEAGLRSTIMECFGNFTGKPRFNPYDVIEIPKSSYGKTKKNKNSFMTTVGIYIFNKGCIEDMSDVLGYINHTITADVYDDINQDLSYALLENRITTEQLKNFIIQTQIYMSCASALCPSHDIEMLLITNKAEKKKKELEKKYKDGLEKKDLSAIKSIENELIDFAKEELKDCPSADMYNSGARSSWGNNFKNMYLIKGAIRRTDGSYDYVSSSYISGLHKEDFAKSNDAGVEGPYSRSNKTKSGGYLEKQFTAATQHVKVLDPGSDCGTTRGINITLDKSNIKDWMYCFVINKNGSLTEITSESKDSFIGKTVKMRFAAMCKSKNGICEKCAGTLYNRIGIQNIGLGTMVMASSMKNTAMKRMHDSSLNLTTIDPYEVFDIKS